MGINRIPALQGGPFGVRSFARRRITPYYATSLPWDTWVDPGRLFYSDNATTAAVAGDPVRLGGNLMNNGASLNMNQATLANRYVYRRGSNGKAWIEGDGARYFDSLTIPATAGFATAHLVKFTENGYYNLFDVLADNVMIWIDGSGRIEFNAGVGTASGFNDGNWHRVLSFTNPSLSGSGPAGCKLWVDGTLVITASSRTASANLTVSPFYRIFTNSWKGGVGPFGFGSFDLTPYVTDLDAWLATRIPT